MTPRICSPATLRPSRLVANTRTPGHSRRTWSTRLATWRSTCSQLSRTSNSSLPRQEVHEDVDRRHSGARLQPERCHQRIGHRLRVAHPGQLHEPRPVAEIRYDLGCHLEREPVLPTPPTPVSVTSDDPRTSVGDATSSASRPTNEVDLTRQVARKRVERSQRRELAPRGHSPSPGRCARDSSDRADDARRDRRGQPDDHEPSSRHQRHHDLTTCATLISRAAGSPSVP